MTSEIRARGRKSGPPVPSFGYEYQRCPRTTLADASGRSLTPAPDPLVLDPLLFPGARKEILVQGLEGRVESLSVSKRGKGPPVEPVNNRQGQFDYLPGAMCHEPCAGLPAQPLRTRAALPPYLGR